MFRLSILTRTLILAAMPIVAFSNISVAKPLDKKIPQEEVDKFKKESADIKNVALPMTRLYVSQKGGQTKMMSENGRYMFNGPIVDTWLQLEINSYDDAMFSKNHLAFDQIGFKGEMLAPLIYGTGKEQKVLAFVSGDGQASRQFIEQIKPLEKDFTFELIVVPENSSDSIKIATAYSCPTNPSSALKKLMSGKGVSDLTPTKDCDYQMLNNRVLAFGLLGFNELPAVIAPSSRVATGDVNGGWAKFLMENVK